MPAPSLRRAAAHARFLTLTAVTAAALAACGGGGDAATPAASSTAATAAAARTTALGIPAAPVRAADGAGVEAGKESVKGADPGAAKASATQALRRALATPRAGEAAVLAVDAASAAAQLLDYAEAQLPAYFPTREATQQLAPFAFRHYPDTGIYLGVVLADGAGYPAQGVYVMGGPFGDAPVAVGQLTDYVTPAPYTVALSTDKALVQQGQSTTVRVALTRAPGFTGAVQVSLGGLPAGVTAGTATITANATEADIVLSAQADAPHSLPATAALTATSAGALLHKPLTVTVRGAAGSVDTSFGGGVQTTPVGFEDYANAVAVQPDGKVIVAGSSSSNAGTFVTLVRYGRDGGLDTSFGNGGKLVTPVGPNNDSAQAVAVQADGRIVVAGSTAQAGTGADFLVLRYLANGTLDASFGNGGKVITSFSSDADRAMAVAVQPDGKIVVGGESQSGASSSGVDFALARYLPDGQLDAGFGTGGKVVTAISSHAGKDSVYALALPVVDGEQRILAVGGEGNFQAARYRANGQLDAGFGAGGKVTGLFNANIGSARSVVLLPGGQAVLAGSVVNDFAAVQLTVQGTLDGSFGTGGRFVHAVSAGNWDSATALVRQADGKLVLGGWVYAGNSSAGDFAALRLNANGQLDTSFGTAGVAIHPTAAGLKSDIAHGLVLQADPRVSTVRAIQAGEASGSNYDFSVIRLWL